MIWRPFLAGVLIVFGFATAASRVAAQEASARLSANNIAVLNIQLISQKYKPFLEEAKKFAEEGKELQARADLRQSELETVQTSLQKSQPGSAEFLKLREQYAKVQRDLQLFVQESQQRMRDKELKLHLALQREIAEVVKGYCKEKGIRLVLRVENASLEDNQPTQQILQALGRGVLYEDGLDITADVLKLLEERNAKAGEKTGEKQQ